jgi:hypothetical protein
MDRPMSMDRCLKLTEGAYSEWKNRRGRGHRRCGDFVQACLSTIQIWSAQQRSYSWEASERMSLMHILQHCRVEENHWLGTSEVVNRRHAKNNLTLPPSAAQFVLRQQVPSHTFHAAFDVHSFSYALSIVQPEMLRIVETTAYLKFACSRDFPTPAVR